MSAPPAPNDPPAPDPPAPDPPAPPGWRESLPEEIRAHPAIENFETPEALVREHINVQKLIGGDKVNLPQESWTDDDYKAYYTKLGRPESVEGYDLTGIDHPEGVPWDNDLQGRMLQTMHKAGVPQGAVAEILKDYSEYGTERFKAVQELERQFQVDAKKALREEWGNAFDEKVKRATETWHAVFGEAGEALRGVRLANGDALGNHPELLKMMDKIATMTGEHSALNLPGGDLLGKTPKEASSDWEKLQTDQEFIKALYDREHAGHKAAVERRRVLFAQMHPEED